MAVIRQCSISLCLELEAAHKTQNNYQLKAHVPRVPLVAHKTHQDRPLPASAMNE